MDRRLHFNSSALSLPGDLFHYHHPQISSIHQGDCHTHTQREKERKSAPSLAVSKEVTKYLWVLLTNDNKQREQRARPSERKKLLPDAFKPQQPGALLFSTASGRVLLLLLLRLGSLLVGFRNSTSRGKWPYFDSIKSVLKSACVLFAWQTGDVSSVNGGWKQKPNTNTLTPSTHHA